MAYGDPLYDVAWQDFWSPACSWSAEVDFVDAFRQHYSENSILPERFEERIDCYKMIIGANCLSFFAKSDQQGKYNYARDELTKIEARIVGLK